MAVGREVLRDLAWLSSEEGRRAYSFRFDKDRPQHIFVPMPQVAQRRPKTPMGVTTGPSASGVGAPRAG